MRTSALRSSGLAWLMLAASDARRYAPIGFEEYADGEVCSGAPLRQAEGVSLDECATACVAEGAGSESSACGFFVYFSACEAGRCRLYVRCDAVSAPPADERLGDSPVSFNCAATFRRPDARVQSRRLDEG